MKAARHEAEDIINSMSGPLHPEDEDEPLFLAYHHLELDPKLTYLEVDLPMINPGHFRTIQISVN